MDGKKVIKPQDLVRMYENLVQSLHMDILHSGLAGIQAMDAYIELVNMASTVQCN